MCTSMKLQSSLEDRRLRINTVKWLYKCAAFYRSFNASANVSKHSQWFNAISPAAKMYELSIKAVAFSLDGIWFVAQPFVLLLHHFRRCLPFLISPSGQVKTSRAVLSHNIDFSFISEHQRAWGASDQGLDTTHITKTQPHLSISSQWHRGRS